ncbi:MAG: hypothetical protein U0974_01880 [Gemmatimonadales bacterium]|nr:hypothetical protein [Gemmatimonadales bacterium]
MVDAQERLAGLVEEVRDRVKALNSTSEIAEREVIAEMGYRIAAFFPALRSGTLKQWRLSKDWRVRPYHDEAGDAGEALVFAPGFLLTGPIEYPGSSGLVRGSTSRVIYVAVDHAGRLWLTGAKRKRKGFGARLGLSARGTALWDPIADHEDFPSSAMFKTLAFVEEQMLAETHAALFASQKRAEAVRRATAPSRTG